MTILDNIVLPIDPWDDHTISSNDLVDGKDCPICYIDFEIGDNVAKLNCGHIFHKNCIILWFDKKISSPTCPICRKDMFNNQNKNNQSVNNTNEVQIINDDEDQSYSRVNVYTPRNTNQRSNKSGSKCCILI